MDIHDANHRIDLLERRLWRTQLYGGITAVSALLIGLSLSHPIRAEAAKDGVIRTRGVVIVDANGKERILIGAPIPSAKNRVRTDLARVKQTWGKRFPAKYMDWYEDYRHDTNGIVILDENGYDRLAVGDPVPDPNIGKRIGPSTGIIINDEQGFERSGWGMLNVKGVRRVVLGMDSNREKEGLTLFLVDDGATGIEVGDSKHNAFLGAAQANDEHTGLSSPFFGLVVKGPGTTVKTYGSDANSAGR
jgi:hypothetical protein